MTTRETTIFLVQVWKRNGHDTTLEDTLEVKSVDLGTAIARLERSYPGSIVTTDGCNEDMIDVYLADNAERMRQADENLSIMLGWNLD